MQTNSIVTAAALWAAAASTLADYGLSDSDSVYPIADYKPAEGEHVSPRMLVCCKNGKGEKWWTIGQWSESLGWSAFSVCGVMITHWALLPPLPEDDSKED